jgi:hypothetical protein
MNAWRSPSRPAGRSVSCSGFLGGLFGGSTKEGAALQLDDAPLEDYSEEELDEVVLTELTTPDGVVSRVVYRNGSVVDATALETLCDRVRHRPPLCRPRPARVLHRHAAHLQAAPC